MATIVLAIKIAVALAIIAVFLKWRYRLPSSGQVISGLGRLPEWLSAHKAEVLRYTRIAQAVVGLILMLLGTYFGKEHFHLILQGIRTEGTIVDYKQVSMANGTSVRWDYASLPIVRFRAADRPVQFVDWMGAKAEVRNVAVTVLYDPADPSAAMIDRPVWNWIPWAPTFAVGLFLVLVALKGWLRARSNIGT